MTQPTGTLEWGQAGTYQAPNDRSVIAALSNRKAGIVQAATMAAGSGLGVTLGPFLAIIDAGDGTFLVVHSKANTTVIETAGPASGSRTDNVWVDIDPDGASTWQINLRDSASIVGRLGVNLGTITVPQGANVATAFSFAPALVSYSPFVPQTLADVYCDRGYVGNGTDFNTLTSAGLYIYSGAVAPNQPPLPATVTWLDVTLTNGAQYIKQVAGVTDVTQQARYVRYRTSGNWSAWTRHESFERATNTGQTVSIGSRAWGNVAMPASAKGNWTTAAGLITATRAGTFYVGCYYTFPDSAGTIAILAFKHNAFDAGGATSSGIGGGSQRGSGSYSVPVAVGDTIGLQIFSLVAAAATYTTQVEIVFQG